MSARARRPPCVRRLSYGNGWSFLAEIILAGALRRMRVTSFGAPVRLAGPLLTPPQSVRDD